MYGKYINKWKVNKTIVGIRNFNISPLVHIRTFRQKNQ